MADLKLYLDEEEMDFVKQQPKGYVRNIIRRFMDHGSAALTPEELIYLRDHGGTKGVIVLAKREKTEPQVDQQTGELL